MTTTGAIPVWLGIMNGAVLPVDARNHVANLETGHVFVPKAPETLTYDADGNLLSDGRWTYTWDAENRVVKVESRSDTPQASWRRVEWTYDALGRRIRQTTRVWTNNTWAVVEDLELISDPMLFGRHIAELNASDNTLVRSYVWGLDLSGTMDGAGGVGGLLSVTLHTATGPAAGAHFAAYDGNGDVVALVSASTENETARYENGPFGEPIRITGPAANLNPFRFSTKRTCNTTDLVLYEYRVYNPSLGRWLGRDPIEGRGGLNLCGFVGNNPVSRVDPFGLSCYGGGGADFREKLACLCTCGISKCKRAAQVASDALAEAQKRFPADSLHNGAVLVTHGDIVIGVTRWRRPLAKDVQKLSVTFMKTLEIGKPSRRTSGKWTNTITSLAVALHCSQATVLIFANKP